MQWILKSLILFICAIFSYGHAHGEDYLPAYIHQLDERFTHHAIIVEKSTHRLYLYENNNTFPKLIKTYKVATGAIIGDKQVEGDRKTPEGIYQFQNFHRGEELVEKWGDTGLIYGAGAFTLNYPNIIDLRAGKTGGGIWLHSTDDDSRVGKGLDSRGCVVAVDSDLKDISKYIDLKNTPVIIVQNLHYLKKSTWIKNKEQLVEKVLTWANAWREKDFKTYIKQYSEKEFHSASKGGFHDYRRYKKAIFSRIEKPEISFSNISILTHDEYAVVTLEQKYRSNLVQDTGKKVLYLKKNDSYEWKIVAEHFHQLNGEQELAFVPSLRFFSGENETVVKNQQRKTSNIKEN